MTSEREASERAAKARKQQMSKSVSAIRAERAKQDGAPLGESSYIQPEDTNHRRKWR